MQLRNGQVVLGASDIVNFLECQHLTTLDLRQLSDPQPLPAADEQLQLLARKGQQWEAQYLEGMRAKHADVVEIDASVATSAAAAATLEAMRSGVSLIYQATLLTPGYMGRADFLRRVAGHSRFGNYAYEVIDTKLAKSAKAGHVLQLCFYSWLVAEMIDAAPAYMYVVLGDGTEQAFRFDDYSRYFHRVRRRMTSAVHAAVHTYPEPCERCGSCRWNERCTAQRTADDHLWQVANIRRQQIDRLEAAGITTMRGLAVEAPERAVPRLQAETFRKLRAQAHMHVQGATNGAPCFELLPQADGERGFARLPPPCEGDVYFDMEGDPLHEGGLEYLFGVTWREAGVLQFRAFWAHDRDEEKRAFEALMDFFAARQQQWPDLHIYHYAAYESTALKKLMSLHGTREAQVDALLRERRMVDLYRVVCEGLLASTPSYSLKDIERFYRGARAGEVVSAGASIVSYERWREERDAALLRQIEDYNRDDCHSTAQLHQWICGLIPTDAGWRSVGEVLAKEEDKSEGGAAPLGEARADAARVRRSARRAHQDAAGGVRRLAGPRSPALSHRLPRRFPSARGEATVVEGVRGGGHVGAGAHRRSRVHRRRAPPEGDTAGRQEAPAHLGMRVPGAGSEVPPGQRPHARRYACRRHHRGARREHAPPRAAALGQGAASGSGCFLPGPEGAYRRRQTARGGAALRAGRASGPRSLPCRVRGAVSRGCRG